MNRQKMQRRINELKEECDREKSLRKSLEETHNTLMERVRDMEKLVESERKEVIIFKTFHIKQQYLVQLSYRIAHLEFGRL